MPLIIFDLLIQVAWLGSPNLKASWEPASNLKQSVIDEYEHGEEVQVDDDVDFIIIR